MSSFTSTSEPLPGPRDRLRLAVLAGSLALFLGAVAGFNAWEDPYGMFGGEAIIVAVSGATANAPLKALYELGRESEMAYHQAEIAITGDSRGRQLTPRRFDLVEGRPSLNFSCGGSTLEESLTLLNLHAARLRNLKTLIITVPLERFTEAAIPNRSLEGQPVASSRLRYLLNWQITYDSWRVFSGRQRAEAQRADDTPERLARINSAVVAAWRKLFAAKDPVQVQMRLSSLQETVAPFRARGVQVILWRPPLRQEIQDLILDTQAQPTWDRLLPELQKLGRVADFTSRPGINGRPFTFSDPVHTKDSPALLAALLHGE